MSRKNNVNPDHYKVAGRDRPGEDIVHEQQKQALAREKAEQRGARERKAAAAATSQEGSGSRTE